MENWVRIDLGPADVEHYKETRRMLQGLYDEYKIQMNVCKSGDDPDKKEEYVFLEGQRKILSDMLGENEFIIEWLDTGRRPGNKRGIERRAAYQKEKLMDPVRMQAFASHSTAGSPANITDWEAFKISDALSRLTERERDCYVLKHGQCFTFAEISDLLGISKGSVETYVERAQKKISEDLNKSLFLAG